MAAKNLIPKSRAKTAYGLLSEVSRLILKEPRRYDQGEVLYKIDPEFREEDDPPCGTVCCIGGWIAMLKLKRPGFNGALSSAQRILGLTEAQAGELFDGGAAGRSYRDGKRDPEHALRGAEHIKRFQEHHAAQLKAKRV